MNLNKAQIYGRLTKEPELKALPSGSHVISLSMATNYVYKDKDGKKQEEADFHNVVFFGKQAEVIAKYVGKGDTFFVEGRMKTRSWDDKDSGKKMYRTEIIGDKFDFGDGNKKREANSAPASKSNEPEVPDYPEEEINPKDIPF